MLTSEATLQQVLAAVQSARKYADICPATVRAIAEAELRINPSAKEATKRAKRKLHQIGGAYQRQDMHYGAWLAELRAAPDIAARRAICQRIMAAHASSNERLPYLDELYGYIGETVGPIHSLVDIACGLNPLALDWMGLPPEARYDCLDIYADQMAFLQSWLALSEQPGTAICQDALLKPPQCVYDVALLLKTVPCLQQLDAAATHRLLAELRAATLVVSFPARSLGGRDVGMVTNYAQRFEAQLSELGYNGEQRLVGNELVYIVTTGRQWATAVAAPDAGE